jgi:putative ABC transport system permease protein
MFLPLFSLVAASLCMVSYVVLVTNEQRQEFGVLRAIGAKPRGITKIISAQSLIILFLCYAVGIVVGTLVTWLILIPQPFVTIGTVAEIAEWLLAAFAATLIISLYPAIRFAKKPILEIIT